MKEEAMKLKELDVVELIRELPEIPNGTQGTVVLVYPGGGEVEVEFFDQEGNTIGVERVSVELLRKVRRMKKNNKHSKKAKINELIESLVQDPQVRVKNPDEVKKYLMKFSDIIDLVPKVVEISKKHFPESQLVLALYLDPEIDDQYLVLYVRLNEYKEDFVERVDEAEAEFLNDLVDKKGNIFLTTDFRKPED
jgi:uncharacterized membrane-anchored protein YjiN (DUF445 family)